MKDTLDDKASILEETSSASDEGISIEDASLVSSPSPTNGMNGKKTNLTSEFPIVSFHSGKDRGATLFEKNKNNIRNAAWVQCGLLVS